MAAQEEQQTDSGTKVPPVGQCRMKTEAQRRDSKARELVVVEAVASESTEVAGDGEVEWLAIASESVMEEDERLQSTS